MSALQLRAASLEVFYRVQLKSGDDEMKCHCLVFKVLLRVNSSLVGLGPLNRISFESPLETAV